MNKTVIHVTESYGGGVAYAISEYVTSTPELKHILIYSTRNDSKSSSNMFSIFHESRELPKSWFSRILYLMKLSKQFPDAIFHAHSSWAGVFVRTSILKSTNKIIYTPHCFAFERRDIPKIFRLLIWISEYLLSINTSYIAGCSFRETELASSFLTSTAYLPNVVPTTNIKPALHKTYNIATAGRICPQKDPMYFLEFATELRKLLPAANFLWIGGGNYRFEQALLQAGIDITGWSTREESQRHIANSDLYVHTAAWEGFPLSILDSLAVKTSVIARAIPALCAENSIRTEITSAKLAELAFALLKDNSTDYAVNQQKVMNEKHSKASQVSILKFLYA